MLLYICSTKFSLPMVPNIVYLYRMTADLVRLPYILYFTSWGKDLHRTIALVKLSISGALNIGSYVQYGITLLHFFYGRKEEKRLFF